MNAKNFMILASLIPSASFATPKVSVKFSYLSEVCKRTRASFEDDQLTFKFPNTMKTTEEANHTFRCDIVSTISVPKNFRLKGAITAQSHTSFFADSDYEKVLSKMFIDINGHEEKTSQISSDKAFVKNTLELKNVDLNACDNENVTYSLALSTAATIEVPLGAAISGFAAGRELIVHLPSLEPCNP